MSQKSYDNKPTLYLIPTPIGNMEDITLRSINMLKEVDVIFSEDTRETLKLLNYLEINKKLISCHKFNEDKVYLKVIEYLEKGSNVSRKGLISSLIKLGYRKMPTTNYFQKKFLIKNKALSIFIFF